MNAAPLKHTCPECVRTFSYPEKAAGKIVDCPACKQRIRLPAAVAIQPIQPAPPKKTELVQPKKRSPVLIATLAAGFVLAIGIVAVAVLVLSRPIEPVANPEPAKQEVVVPVVSKSIEPVESERDRKKRIDEEESKKKADEHAKRLIIERENDRRLKMIASWNELIANFSSLSESDSNRLRLTDTSPNLDMTLEAIAQLDRSKPLIVFFKNVVPKIDPDPELLNRFQIAYENWNDKNALASAAEKSRELERQLTSEERHLLEAIRPKLAKNFWSLTRHEIGYGSYGVLGRVLEQEFRIAINRDFELECSDEYEEFRSRFRKLSLSKFEFIEFIRLSPEDVVEIERLYKEMSKNTKLTDREIEQCRRNKWLRVVWNDWLKKNN